RVDPLFQRSGERDAIVGTVPPVNGVGDTHSNTSSRRIDYIRYLILVLQCEGPPINVWTLFLRTREKSREERPVGFALRILRLPGAVLRTGVAPCGVEF